MSPQAEAVQLASSFRDSAGFVFERDGVLFRQVNKSFAAEFDAYTQSGLHEALLSRGLTVPFERVSLSQAAHAESAHAVLRPEMLPFISYPYEWSPGQLREAALTTLAIQDIALDFGMSLRDATAFNIQFHGGRCVHIDTLSFAPYAAGEQWVAYRQFCQHFLAPLALQTMVDVRLSSLLLTNLDGVPLDLASNLLPGTTKLRPSLMLHLHGQAASARRAAGAGARRQAHFSERALRGVVDSLRSSVEKLRWRPGGTTWSDYYEEADHYSVEAMDSKVQSVSRWLDALPVKRVWDLGANTGRFSRLAAERGADVVAFDIDPGAVERAWREKEAGSSQGTVLPLVLDLSVPSPALGWANAERMSLAERGPADLVLALALVHHLAIAGGVPLGQVAAYFASLAPRLIVEWVPRADPKVETLLSTRPERSPHYDHEAFLAGFAQYFTIRDEVTVTDTGRILYLMEARQDG